MPQIKFSHRYKKLKVETKQATLLQIFQINFVDLCSNFVYYDTVFISQGFKCNYELPKTRLLILLFMDQDNGGYLFTTIRRWTPEKEAYYKRLQGKLFEVIYT